MKFILVLIQLAVVVSVFGDSSGEKPQPCKNCGPHAFCNDCASACPRTCQNLREVFVCTKQCVRRCDCKPGYVLHKGKCILIADCPKVCCGENEEFRTGLSSSCDIPTCANKDIIITKPKICTKDYVSACVCINDTVRHPITCKCVKPKYCPKDPKIKPQCKTHYPPL